MLSVQDKLAERLKLLRTQQGWSLQELADNSGVSRATLSRIENRDVSPTAEVLGKICATFEMTLTRLLSSVEHSFQAVVRRDEQSIWSDDPTGFSRRVVSPPSGVLNSEVIECELKADCCIRYDRPPVAGLEHHLIVLSGSVQITIEGVMHDLAVGDCLRYQLFGSSEFKTEQSPVRYLLVLGPA